MIHSIQKILFPIENICDKERLYFRGRPQIANDNTTFRLGKGESISFDTYFNILSLEKWKHFTTVSEIGLRLSVNGTIRIDLLHLTTKPDSQVSRTITSSSVVEMANDCEIWFDSNLDKGVLAFEIHAMTDATVSGLEYIGKSDIRCNDLSIALGICTYKREDYIIRNVGSIHKDIISNRKSLLYDRCDIYIADNGQTLDRKQFADSDHTFLFKNLNYGGSGGFTRTMIEAIFHSGRHYDYIILMDDDIILDTRIFERLYPLLQLIKLKFRMSMIGGAMLCKEQPNIQFESGARFTRKKGIMTLNVDYDLENVYNIVANEQWNEANYNAWCFCCIPSNFITESNLPLPLFIHYDDAEYGIRNNHELILINGICVWHPYSKGKSPLWMTYYDIRNQWITYAKHNFRRSVLNELKFLQDSFYSCISKYRYEHFYLILQGLKDFYSGYEPFKKKDPLKFHVNLSGSHKYQWQPIDLSKIEVVEKDMKTPKLISKLKLFGPAFRKPVYVSKAITRVDNSFRKEIWVIDKDNSCGYCLRKSYGSTIRCFLRMNKLLWFIIRNHRKAWDSWEKGCNEIATLTFWENYLHLNDSNKE